MKRFLVLAVFLCAGACALQAQVVDTTVCDVLKNPASFNGKIVRIKGTASAGFDQFILRGPSCGQQVDGVWLAYPEGTKGKAGPDAMLEIQPAHNFAGKYTAPDRTPVKLVKDKEFKQFDSLLSEVHNKGPYTCLGCRRYQVDATLVGRLDGIADATVQRDSAGKITGFGGFGNMNAYPARLVIQSVSDVAPKEIDYSKVDELVKGTPPSGQPGGMYDPLATATKAAAAIGDSPAGIQAQKDAQVFPKKNEHNGVNIEYGRMNEVPDKDPGLGAEDSPDGVLYNCTFNMNHLQGLELPEAILHIGQHVSELRNPPAAETSGVPVYILEANAWAVTASASMGMREKYLVLPGAHVLWNWKWTQADLSSNFSTALASFFSDEALLSQ
ncbi:MAG TPA: hypothetical protein VF730_16945 [Terracidiphilus sp.]